jgi:hypothetical protein
MADEAGSLPEAVETYEKRLNRKASEAQDFLEIAQVFKDWRAALNAAIRSSATFGL